MSTRISVDAWSDEYQDLVDAARAGETIQVRVDMDHWSDCKAVGFHYPRTDYRVKPRRGYCDPINPSHYKGAIECIDYQKSISTPEEFRGYLRLQAVKYIHRLNAKDTPTTNIDKALWYLNRLKKELET